MNKNIEKLTLLLMYLTSWEEEGFCYDENSNLENNILSIGQILIVKEV